MASIVSRKDGHLSRPGRHSVVRTQCPRVRSARPHIVTHLVLFREKASRWTRMETLPTQRRARTTDTGRSHYSSPLRPPHRGRSRIELLNIVACIGHGVVHSSRANDLLQTTNSISARQTCYNNPCGILGSSRRRLRNRPEQFAGLSQRMTRRRWTPRRAPAYELREGTYIVQRAGP